MPPLSYLTFWTVIESYLYFDNSCAYVLEWLWPIQSLHIMSYKPHIHFLVCHSEEQSKDMLCQLFCNTLKFLWWGVISPLSTPCQLPTVAATIHIWRLSPPSLTIRNRVHRKEGGYWVAATHNEIKKTDIVDMMISTFYSIFSWNMLLKLTYD